VVVAYCLADDSGLFGAVFADLVFVGGFEDAVDGPGVKDGSDCGHAAYGAGSSHDA